MKDECMPKHMYDITYLCLVIDHHPKIRYGDLILTSPCIRIGRRMKRRIVTIHVQAVVCDKRYLNKTL